MSGISKRVSGSWVSGNYGIMKTATDTITTLPAVLYPNAETATVGLKGNTVQNGTPTPNNPIQPQECGERTGNLCPMIFSHTGVVDDNGGTGSYDTRLWSEKIPVSESQSYYVVIDGTASNDEELSLNRVIQYDANGVFISRINVVNLTSTSFTTSANCRYVVLDIRTRTLTVDISVSDINTLMLNSGTTAIPYEPYGYKIPISSANTTTPVYLGEVQTTRNIEKLVFDGTEDWGISSTYKTCYLRRTGYLKAQAVICYCSHYTAVTNVSSISQVNADECTFNYGQSDPWLYIKDSNCNTVEAFKTLLAQQYAAGTPVTVWYVLATEETGIVNEPLRKIGDYADTVSGITIPTIAGANNFDVLTTLKPSEVSLAYTGWHDATVEEWDGSQWQ